ncbi:hypothetical protein Pcinc_013251 [Petrolisthes cinctipes]|uniref:RNA-directed DNA polymerase n=1 Tax=Petrolisthes cinctipes TaxID=88211 RepID=A0AAE1KUI2_PETCI|nr:hypothetical protein Pcinc_013251 [Petrolisthes cinctipes]
MAHGGGEPEVQLGGEAPVEESRDIVAMLKVLSIEQAQRANEQARRADEQAQEMARKMDNCTLEFGNLVQHGLSNVKEEAREFTVGMCDQIKKELREEVEELRRVLEQQVTKPETGIGTGLGCNDGLTCPQLEGKHDHMVSPVAVSVGDCEGSLRCSDNSGTPPSHRRLRAPVLTPLASPSSSPPPQIPIGDYPHRKKPAEFDGGVAWEAYQAQFDMLANAQGWDEKERVLQLVACLCGTAVEVLSHLTLRQRMSYQCVLEAMQRKFGQHQQAEVYRARLKNRMRGRGESLPHLAQDLEALVRRAYPVAPEEMVTVLARDYFVDALQDQQLQIYVMQAHPSDVQMALAKALEFESFLRATGMRMATVGPQPEVRALWTKVPRDEAAAGKDSPKEFQGACWECGSPVPYLPKPQACRAGGKHEWAGRWGHTPADTTRAPQSVSCHRSAVGAAQVDGFVDGRPCRLVVDTGAERTFVRTDMVVAQTLPVTRQQLCGVTGHCMPLKRPVEVCVRVGSVEEKLPVYVADMEEPCLLDLDYLTQSEACVDLGRRLLKVRGVNVPLLPMDAGEKSENCVQCKLSGKEQLPEGHESEKSADMGSLPQHLWDLAKRSTSYLTEEEAKKMRKVLVQYADVFSQGDMDLGRTALVKHSVNTGNSSPVKQAPRRVALAKREEMQQAVESMAALGLIERTFEEELGRLEEVLQRLRDANLKLSPKKCLFFQHEVPFLGHIVGKDGVRTDPLKVTAVKEWPVPNSVAEVRSFVGLCTYYRRFVKGFASVAAPLHQLTRKGAHFQWNEACQQAFEDLKQALVEVPVLPYPDPGNRYLLDTDASAEEFTIRTDHAALRWLKTLKVPEGQLARWLGRLEQYNYHVEHRPGRVHINADSLSRRPCLPDCNHCTRRDPDPVCRRLLVAQDLQEADNKWRKSQREDSDLAPVIHWLEAGLERPNWEEVAAESTTTKCLEEQWETLRLDRGLLSKHWMSTGGSSTGMWLVVVPRALRAELLQEVHAGLTSGHQGVKKTLSRLRRCFYWIGMRKDVEEWCRACDVCSAKKGPAKRMRAPLQLYQVGAPMERVAVDIAGPFPLTSRGNRFICVVMDYFTKWPEAYALPNHEAGTVAEVLVDQFFARFGVPRELHSDQGREFESRVL